MRRSLLVCSCLVAIACGPSEIDPCVERQEVRICADGTTLRGIDVSYYQSVVDWQKVKGAGMAFAFARVSDGLATVDTQFANNWPAMRAAGIVRGTYQFFRPSKDPVAQADLLVDRIMAAGGLMADDLPPVCDFEVLDGVSSAAAVAAVQSWLARIETRLRRRPIIYSGNNMAATTMMHFSTYPLWVPHYGATCPLVPDGWSRWAFWQDSATGSVAGVSGDVDTNYFNGDAAALAAFIASTDLAAAAPDMAGQPPRDLADRPDMAPDPCRP